MLQQLRHKLGAANSQSDRNAGQRGNGLRAHLLSQLDQRRERTFSAPLFAQLRPPANAPRTTGTHHHSLRSARSWVSTDRPQEKVEKASSDTSRILGPGFSSARSGKQIEQDGLRLNPPERTAGSDGAWLPARGRSPGRRNEGHANRSSGTLSHDGHAAVVEVIAAGKANVVEIKKRGSGANNGTAV